MEVLEKKMTVKEYLQLELPDDANYRYELINGILVKKNSPSPVHQRISRKLLTAIDNFISKNNNGEVFSAPIGVILDDTHSPQPDLLFVSKEKSDIVDDFDGIVGVPDLVVEIVSPSSFKRDTVLKRNLYEKHGVQEYWVVFPTYQSIQVFTLKNSEYVVLDVFEVGDKLTSSVLKDFSLEVEKVF